MIELVETVQVFLWSIVGVCSIIVIGMARDIWEDLARERRLRKWRRENGYPSPNDARGRG